MFGDLKSNLPFTPEILMALQQLRVGSYPPAAGLPGNCLWETKEKDGAHLLVFAGCWGEDMIHSLCWIIEYVLPPEYLLVGLLSRYNLDSDGPLLIVFGKFVFSCRGKQETLPEEWDHYIHAKPLGDDIAPVEAMSKILVGLCLSCKKKNDLELTWEQYQVVDNVKDGAELPNFFCGECGEGKLVKVGTS